MSYRNVVPATRWGWSGGWWCANDVFVGKPVNHVAEDLPVGCCIYRDHHGVRHWVHVVPPAPENERGFHRYVYQGERYRSLTAVVRVIAPTLRGRSGNDFFRLRKRNKR